MLKTITFLVSNDRSVKPTTDTGIKTRDLGEDRKKNDLKVGLKEWHARWQAVSWVLVAYCRRTARLS